MSIAAPVRSLPKADKSTSNTSNEMLVGDQFINVDQKTGEILSSQSEVITTQKPNRPFSNSLILPKRLSKYKISDTALKLTHIRFGNRLKSLSINPSHMPDIQVKYGHPAGLSRHKKGHYIVTVSRKPQNRVPVNRKEMWQHYRHALAQSYLDAIERASPDTYDKLRMSLDNHYAQSKQLALQAVKLSRNKTARWQLSLQIMMWSRIPAWNRKHAKPEEFEFYEQGKLKGWRNETASIIADVQKLGWKTLDKHNKSVRTKLKSKITKQRNHWDRSGIADILSGKRRRLIKDIREAETKLQALDQLERRQNIIREFMPS